MNVFYLTKLCAPYSAHTHKIIIVQITIAHAIQSYIDHPESKYRNADEIGKLKRRYIKIDKIRYIGKESNNLEHTEVLGVDKDSYTSYHLRS